MTRTKKLLVEGVIQLQYIGRTIKHIDNDWISVYWNIGKAQAVWRRSKK